jgi:polyadenylation factor subunit 2
MDDEGPKKLAHRRTIDHGSTLPRWVLERSIHKYTAPSRIRPEASYIVDILPPEAYRNSPITSLATKFVHTSINKIKHPVLVVQWTPEGRRLLTGSVSGEFTLWNGMTFNFETIMQAHDNGIRSMVYSHNEEWLLSGDHEGQVKFWQPNFNNVNILDAHREVVREIAFSPNDTSFVTASDDGTLKVWRFHDSSVEATLTGHGWDVKCADWHSSLGLIASGSKDNLVKLWDPRSGGKCLTTLHGFKNTVTKTMFQKTGGQMLLASTSRDHSGRVFDLRMMRDLLVLRGHKSDVSSLAWHPIHPSLLTTGTHDGTISHFLLDSSMPENTTGLSPVLQIPNAHDWPIWSLQYHPLGHILCSGSNDKMTRFWCRSRPGDETAFKDRYYDETEKPSNQSQYQYQSRGYQPKSSQSGYPRKGREPTSPPPLPPPEEPLPVKPMPSIPGLSWT